MFGIKASFLHYNQGAKACLWKIFTIFRTSVPTFSQNWFPWCKEGILYKKSWNCGKAFLQISSMNLCLNCQYGKEERLQQPITVWACEYYIMIYLNMCVNTKPDHISKETGIIDECCLLDFKGAPLPVEVWQSPRRLKQNTVKPWWRGTVKCVGQEWDSLFYTTLWTAREGARYWIVLLAHC